MPVTLGGLKRLMQLVTFQGDWRNVSKKSLMRLKESLKEEGFSSIGRMTMCFLELHVFTESITVKCSKLTNVRCLEITCLLFDFSKQLNTEEELLEFEATQFPILQAMIAYKEPYDKLWRTTLSFHNKNEAWLNGNNVFLYYFMDTLVKTSGRNRGASLFRISLRPVEA